MARQGRWLRRSSEAARRTPSKSAVHPPGATEARRVSMVSGSAPPSATTAGVEETTVAKNSSSGFAASTSAWIAARSQFQRERTLPLASTTSATAQGASSE